jgi:copper chaperone CopZ
MSLDNFDQNQEKHEGIGSPKPNSVAIRILGAGLAVALAGDGYLWMRSNDLNDQIMKVQSGTAAQISKLGDSTNMMLKEQNERFDVVAQLVKGANESAANAIKRARMEAQKQNEELNRKLAEQHEQFSQVSGEVAQLKDTTNSKFTEFSTDVDGVKANVENVKASVATTQSSLEKTTADIRADMKRMVGDMGVMSGLIATNSKDLEALRALGERNYFEFDLAKNQGAKRVGDVLITLKKSDPNRNRFTLEVFADDKRVEKKDKTVNEPVQLYVAGNAQPYEIVVNQVKKDQVAGYLSTPKVKLARR